VSNSTTHATWTGRAACHWNGQTHVLSIINAKKHVAQRLYVTLRLLAYAARSRPRGSIRSPPGRGAGVYVISPDPTRSGLDMWTAWTPYRGFGSHSSGPVRTRGGPGPNLEARTVYTGVRHLPMGSRLTGDTLEYVTFFGHVVAPDSPMWWGQVLLLAQSSRPRLGRVMAWSHIRLFNHVTKNSRMGTVSLYSSKGYPSFRVPTCYFLLFGPCGFGASK
jgi:hypothetical protein